MITAYLGLGANLGDRANNIRLALDRLGRVPGIRVEIVSQLIENPAVGGPADSPSFLNAAAKIQTDLSAGDLLEQMLSVERSLGRQRREKWEPRPIDLDLLLYDNDVINTDSLAVPHPLMHQRRFVLEPLAEIAADVVHPLFQKNISTLLAGLR